jgi:hypothetical protein
MDINLLIKELTDQQKHALLRALEEDLGWYSATSVCVSDVEDTLRENNTTPMPDQDAIRAACNHVARKCEIDIDDLIDWACVIAKGQTN